jgi:tryptophan synthase beta chain
MSEKIFSKAKGMFGEFGGSFIPETLVGPIEELTAAYEKSINDKNFRAELSDILKNYVGRPTALTHAKRLSDHLGGAQIYLKREDLNHTGAHKINNTVGQILLAKKMGKTRIIAETGAGQHGVATATVAALFNMKCIVYMGEVDIKRQALNVYKMRLLGAEVSSVTSGSKTLKDAVSEAMRDWVSNIEDSFYILGSVLGPHPYPTMVADFQSIIGLEAREQIKNKVSRLPDLLVACVGGGSNAIGLFKEFLGDNDVKMIGVEAGGTSIEPGQHAARFEGGSPGILQGTLTYLLQDQYGQIQDTHSISAGLDYAGIGPEHANLKDKGRVQYTNASDSEALEAFHMLTKLEGIIPALESSHAVAQTIKSAKKMKKDQIIICNLSGRGDKDIPTVQSYEDKEL